MPRPGPRRGVVGVRFDDTVRDHLEKRAAANGLTLSEQIRQDVSTKNPEDPGAALARAADFLRSPAYTVHTVQIERRRCDVCQEAHQLAVAYYDDRAQPHPEHLQMCVCSRTLTVVQGDTEDEEAQP